MITNDCTRLGGVLALAAAGTTLAAAFLLLPCGGLQRRPIAPRATAPMERNELPSPRPVVEDPKSTAKPAEALEDGGVEEASPRALAREAAIEKLRAVRGAIEVARREDGEVDFVGGPLADASALSPVDRAREFLAEHATIWGLGAVSRDLLLDEEGSMLVPDELETTHVRFHQAVCGVPVLRRFIAVHLDRVGAVTGVTGDVEPLLVGETVDPSPSVTVEAAIDVVRIDAGSAFDKEPSTSLVVVREKGAARLAWAIQVSSIPGGFSREYLIDAHDATVLRVEDRTVSEVAYGLTPFGRSVPLQAQYGSGRYYLADVSRSARIYTCNANDGTGDSGWNFYNRVRNGQITWAWVSQDTDGWFGSAWQSSEVSLHRNMGKTLSFWINTMGRASFDGRNGTLFDGAHARFEGGSNNAVSYQNGVHVFGDGDGRTSRCWSSLDVCAHEFTHTVIAYTCALEYRNQSGAMNEHIADAFGVLAEQRMGNEAMQYNWLMGEEVKLDRAAVRDLSNPARFGDPDHMSRFYAGTQDYGGVHINSGILNKWLHLWVAGGVHPVSSVAVYGTERRLGRASAFRLAEQSYYRSMRYYLTSRSGFSSFRAAMRQSIADYTGWSSGASADAARAFQAIGL